jgi:hypothetical protein
LTLEHFLLTIIGGAGAIGPSVFYALEKTPVFCALDAEYKRWVVAIVTGILSVSAWALALNLGYIPEPDIYTSRYYAEAIWQNGIISGAFAFMSASLIHGHLAMQKRTFTFTPEEKE